PPPPPSVYDQLRAMGLFTPPSPSVYDQLRAAGVDPFAGVRPAPTGSTSPSSDASLTMGESVPNRTASESRLGSNENAKRSLGSSKSAPIKGWRYGYRKDDGTVKWADGTMTSRAGTGRLKASPDDELRSAREDARKAEAERRRLEGDLGSDSGRTRFSWDDRP